MSQINIKVFLIILFLITSRASFCQSEISFQQSSSKTMSSDGSGMRKVFIYTGIGIFEWINVGLGFQLDRHVSVSLKHSNVFVSGSGGSRVFPPYSSGLSCELKYYKDIWIFNHISLNYIYFLSVPSVYDARYGFSPKGSGYEINLGSERIMKDVKGKLQIYWSIGLGISKHKYYPEMLIMPSIKIGVYQNLF